MLGLARAVICSQGGGPVTVPFEGVGTLTASATIDPSYIVDYSLVDPATGYSVGPHFSYNDQSANVDLSGLSTASQINRTWAMTFRFSANAFPNNNQPGLDMYQVWASPSSTDFPSITIASQFLDANVIGVISTPQTGDPFVSFGNKADLADRWLTMILSQSEYSNAFANWSGGTVTSGSMAQRTRLVDTETQQVLLDYDNIRDAWTGNIDLSQTYYLANSSITGYSVSFGGGLASYGSPTTEHKFGSLWTSVGQVVDPQSANAVVLQSFTPPETVDGVQALYRLIPQDSSTYTGRTTYSSGSNVTVSNAQFSISGMRIAATAAMVCDVANTSNPGQLVTGNITINT